MKDYDDNYMTDEEAAIQDAMKTSLVAVEMAKIKQDAAGFCVDFVSDPAQELGLIVDAVLHADDDHSAGVNVRLLVQQIIDKSLGEYFDEH